MIATASARLLRAILADPADDTARLAYSDALEEEGQWERAEFVRVQVELACRDIDFHAKIHAAVRGDSQAMAEANASRPGVFALRKKASRLLNRGEPDNRAAWSRGLHPQVWCRYHRGFVAAVSCIDTDFVRHAEALFAAHPVERVKLTQMAQLRAITGDLRHRRGFGDFRYQVRRWEFGFGRAGVEVVDMVYPETGTEHFYDAVSSACVAYGRWKAGLPALD